MSRNLWKIEHSLTKKVVYNGDRATIEAERLWKLLINLGYHYRRRADGYIVVVLDRLFFFADTSLRKREKRPPFC